MLVLACIAALMVPVRFNNTATSVHAACTVTQAAGYTSLTSQYRSCLSVEDTLQCSKILTANNVQHARHHRANKSVVAKQANPFLAKHRIQFRLALRHNKHIHSVYRAL